MGLIYKTTLGIHKVVPLNPLLCASYTHEPNSMTLVNVLYGHFCDSRANAACQHDAVRSPESEGPHEEMENDA